MLVKVDKILSTFVSVKFAVILSLGNFRDSSRRIYLSEQGWFLGFINKENKSARLATKASKTILVFRYREQTSFLAKKLKQQGEKPC
jgi:hypothetical protein